MTSLSSLVSENWSQGALPDGRLTPMDSLGSWQRFDLQYSWCWSTCSSRKSVWGWDCWRSCHLVLMVDDQWGEVDAFGPSSQAYLQLFWDLLERLRFHVSTCWSLWHAEHCLSWVPSALLELDRVQISNSHFHLPVLSATHYLDWRIWVFPQARECAGPSHKAVDQAVYHRLLVESAFQKAQQ